MCPRCAHTHYRPTIRHSWNTLHMMIRNGPISPDYLAPRSLAQPSGIHLRLRLTTWKRGSTDWYPVWWKVVVTIKDSGNMGASTRPAAVVDGGLVSKPGTPPAVRTGRHNHPVTQRQQTNVEPCVVTFRVSYVYQDLVLH